MKDIFLQSFLAGTAAFAYKNILNQIMYTTGLTPFLYRVLAADLFLPFRHTNTFNGMLLGLLADWVGIVWIALLIAYLIRITDTDFYLAKGGFIGASAWLVVYGFLTHGGLLGIFRPDDFVSGLTSFFFDITIGMVSAAVIVYLNRASFSSPYK